MSVVFGTISKKKGSCVLFVAASGAALSPGYAWGGSVVAGQQESKMFYLDELGKAKHLGGSCECLRGGGRALSPEPGRERGGRAGKASQ